MDEIITGLWLGSHPLDQDVPKLWNVGIKSILSCGLEPLEEAVFSRFKRKFILLYDEPSQDILNSLEDALAFIESALSDGGCLVHCLMGVSRSASFVLAFLMRKFRITYNAALEMVLQKRQILPNIGFINQLKLFEVMNWTVDKDSQIYSHYAATFSLWTSNIGKEAGRTSTSCATEPSDVALYRCRRCRRKLFYSSQIITHTLPQKSVENLKSTIPKPDGLNASGASVVLIRGISVNECPLPCPRNELFTGPLEWTRTYTNVVLGKIYCPGCNSKIGSFNWCGEPCPCGFWVTPAFHFIRDHVDSIKLYPSNPTEINTMRELQQDPTMPREHACVEG